MVVLLSSPNPIEATLCAAIGGEEEQCDYNSPLCYPIVGVVLEWGSGGAPDV